MDSISTHATKKIGEWLLHLGLLTKRQLDSAMELQDENPDLKLGEILIHKGYITQQELDETLAVQEVLKGRTPLKDHPISPKTLSLLPEHFSLQYEVLPLAQIAMRLLVATADGRNFQALDKITLHTGLIVISIEVPRDELLMALGKIYNRDLLPPSPEIVASPPKQPPQPLAAPIQQRGPSDTRSEAAVAEMVNSILEEAMLLNATDIHLTPYEMMLEVRCRADGIMRKILEIPKKLEPAIIKRVTQIVSGLGTGNRVAQQDRFAFPIQGQSIALRMRTMPTLWGDRIRLDLIRANGDVMPFGSLGIDAEDLLSYKQILRRGSGLIVIAGPKGSGRTTSLLSTLSYLDKLSNNIISLEECVVTSNTGVTQIQLNPKQGVTVEAAIEQAIEQDVDVLLISGFQTERELDAIVAACLKGIQVITTLDAFSAVAALGRLRSMGAAPFLLASTLRGIISQRLVRRNCPHCSVEYTATTSERVFLGTPSGAPLTLMRGLGCEHCHQTGYLGQIGVFELLPASSALAEAIAAPQFSVEQLEAQFKHDYTHLLEDAKRKITQGYTSISEVMRVLGDLQDLE